MGKLAKYEAASRQDIEHGKFRNDAIDHAPTRDGKGATGQNLWSAIFRAMFHDGDNPRDARNQIHGPAGAFDHFPRHHPVGDIPVRGHLESTQNGEIDMTAADHGKGISAGEKS